MHIENPQDEKALNVALNKAAGEWEPKALADLLQDLQLSGYDVSATGFDAAEVDDLFSKVHSKEKSTEKVDGAVALVMALDRAMKNMNSGDSIYNHRGFIVL